MGAGLDSAPMAATYDVEDLVTMAWKGEIRVPHFQRGLRWGREDVRRLFDSIVRGYPLRDAIDAGITARSKTLLRSW